MPLLHGCICPMLTRGPDRAQSLQCVQWINTNNSGHFLDLIYEGQVNQWHPKTQHFLMWSQDIHCWMRNYISSEPKICCTAIVLAPPVQCNILGEDTSSLVVVSHCLLSCWCYVNFFIFLHVDRRRRLYIAYNRAIKREWILSRGLCPGGWRRRGAVDNLVYARASHRLQQAVYAAWHQHHDQEAGEAEARRVFVHGPTRPLHLVLYCTVVPRRQFRAVCRQSVQSVRVADRRPRERTQLHQRLQRLQQSVVLAGCSAASGLRHLAAVSLMLSNVCNLSQSCRWGLIQAID